MNVALTKADRAFLKAVGISAEPTLQDTRLELAQRIAKHTAPGIHVPPPQDAARVALVRLALNRLLAATTETE
jgi:hypothetical protein